MNEILANVFIILVFIALTGVVAAMGFALWHSYRRLRPVIAAGTVLLLAGLWVLPFVHFSLADIADDLFDDYSMDLDLQANDQDDMIAAAKKEDIKPQEEDPNRINKVDETTELPPEQLDQPQPVEEQEEKEEEKKDTVVQAPINLNDDKDDEVVESLPQYPGGPVEFMKWLTATLQYPKQALDKKIQGKVMVSFIVGKDGTITNLKIVKSANSLLDAEALRVMKLMPKWEPGKDKGKPCRSMVAIPIVFEI